MTNSIILHCDNSINGIFTAIYDGFVLKKQIIQQFGSYQDTIQIAIGSDTQALLFATDYTITTDNTKASKTVQTIQNQLGFNVFHRIFAALCHFDSDRASVVFGFLIRAFPIGPSICDHLSDPYVIRTMELSQKVFNENQRFLGFLRFRDIGDFLFAPIAPKCDLLPMMEDHFCDRYPCENFVIYDQNRNYALLHPAHQPAIFASGETFYNELNTREQHALTQTDNYETLWKGYFQTMAIAERKNPRCQDNMCAKWYRRNMIEFEESL